MASALFSGVAALASRSRRASRMSLIRSGELRTARVSSIDSSSSTLRTTAAARRRLTVLCDHDPNVVVCEPVDHLGELIRHLFKGQLQCV